MKYLALVCTAFLSMLIISNQSAGQQTYSNYAFSEVMGHFVFRYNVNTGEVCVKRLLDYKNPNLAVQSDVKHIVPNC